MKSLREGVSFALICPALSPRSQAFCSRMASISWISRANVSINALLC
jgi:hypothetical protein